MQFIDISQAASFPAPRELSPDELKKIRALYKEQFTAADLQEYTEPLDGVPLQELISSLREKQRPNNQAHQ